MAPVTELQPADTLPLHEYYPDSATQATLANGLNSARRSCASRFDVRFEPDLLSAGEMPALNRLKYRYLLDDRVLAERDGYHAPPPDLVDPDEKFLEELDERGRLVMFGRHGLSQEKNAAEESAIAELERIGLPARGCNGIAQKTLLGSDKHPVEGDDPDLDRLDDQAYSAMKVDPKVLLAVAGWSRCMQGHGFRYPTPSVANDDARWWKNERPSVLEQRVAVADVDCKDLVRLVALQFSTESRESGRIANKNKVVLGRIKHLENARLRIARQLVGGR